MASSSRKTEDTLQTDPDKSWFCPEQRTEGDLPILRINIHGGWEHHRDMLKILKIREKALSPLLMELAGHSVPVTPLSNPLAVPQHNYLEDSKAPRFSSHHIIQLYSSRDEDYQVDLLIRDGNLYFIAFRRHVLRIGGTRDGSHTGPGIWHVFSNEANALPPFIQATSFNLLSSYGGAVLVGGSEKTLLDIWYNLTTFDIDQQITRDFQGSLYTIMAMYCEVRRSLAMLKLVLCRMLHQKAACELPNFHERTKNMWDSFSGVVLRAKRDQTFSVGSVLPYYCNMPPLKFKFMEDLIGPQGELLLVKLDMKMVRKHITTDRFLEKAEESRRPGQFPNPKFHEEGREEGRRKS